jgi:predicted kinase
LSDYARNDAAGDNRRGAAGELVVVTGPSHTGKSTLIHELVGQLDRPSDIVSIDEVIGASKLPPELRWERGLHAAYDAAAERTSKLLASRGLVFYESTFTYVPPDSRPAQLHPEQLHRLLEIAAEHDADALVVQLTAPLEVVKSRQERTTRLTDRIVTEAWRMHAGTTLEVMRLLPLDTSELSAQEAAALVLGHMGGQQPA